jgi:hypothetical protein
MTVVASHSNCLAILFEHPLNVTEKLLEDIALALGIKPAGSVASPISVQTEADDDASSISLVPETSVSSAGEYPQIAGSPDQVPFVLRELKASIFCRLHEAPRKRFREFTEV